nr:hypothetical protein OG781_07130 [Streptomyces sp. NBC_00830]
MAYGLARRELRPRVPLRPGEGERHHLTSIEGLAALFLDALSSVAYGPEAIVLVLIAAGTRALTATLPVTLVIAALLALTQHRLTAARALGQEVVAVAVHGDPAKARALEESWVRWDPGVRLDVIDSPQRSLVQPIVDYVQRAAQGGRQIAVLIPEVEPLHRRYQILQNQRGLLLAAALRARTDVVVCVVPYRLSL